MKTHGFQCVPVLRGYGGVFRIIRCVWQKGRVGDGFGYSCKFTIALTGRLFHFHKEMDGFLISLLGIRIHFQKSKGGIFA